MRLSPIVTVYSRWPITQAALRVDPIPSRSGDSSAAWATARPASMTAPRRCSTGSPFVVAQGPAGAPPPRRGAADPVGYHRQRHLRRVFLEHIGGEGIAVLVVLPRLSGMGLDGGRKMRGGSRDHGLRSAPGGSMASTVVTGRIVVLRWGGGPARRKGRPTRPMWTRSPCRSRRPGDGTGSQFTHVPATDPSARKT